MAIVNGINSILSHIVAGFTGTPVEVVFDGDSNAFFGSRTTSTATVFSCGHWRGITDALTSLRYPMHATGLWGCGTNITTPGLSIGTGSGLTPQPQYGKGVISSIANGATPTITTGSNHGFATGESVVLQGTGASAVDGTHVVTVTGVTTFTIPATSSSATSSTGSWYNALFGAFAEDMPSLQGGIIHKGQFIPQVAASGTSLSGNGMTIRLSDFTVAPDRFPDVDGEANFYGHDLTWQIGYLNFASAESFTSTPRLTPDVTYENAGGSSIKTFPAIDMKSAASRQWAIARCDLNASEWSDVQSTRTITNITAANPTTVTTSSNHNLAVGNAVYIKGTSIDGYHVVASVPTATTFTIALAATPSSGTSGTMQFFNRGLTFRFSRNLSGTTGDGGPGLLSYQRIYSRTANGGFANNLLLWRGGGTIGPGLPTNILTNTTDGIAALTTAHGDRYVSELFARADQLGKPRLVIEVIIVGVNDAQATVETTSANWKAGMRDMLASRRTFWTSRGVRPAFIIVGAQSMSPTSNAGGTGVERRESFNRLYDTAAKELCQEFNDVASYSWVDAAVDGYVLAAVNGYALGSPATATSQVDVHLSRSGYFQFHLPLWAALASEATKALATSGGSGLRNRRSIP